MLNFKEFRKKAHYLPLDWQKQCYKFYIEGCKEGWEDRDADSEWKRHNPVTDDTGWYRLKSEEFLQEIEPYLRRLEEGCEQ